MKKILCLIMIISFQGLSYSQEKPLTVPEKTNYKATSRYKDVNNFINKLQQASNLLRVENLGVSAEGREIPLVVIGNPLPYPGVRAKSDSRLVVYIQGNIHAGEVEAKEASLMLARDLISEKYSSYLEDLIILIVPIFNPDGNEKISPENRTNQLGPEEGVGVRYNALNLDLNRDAMKLESPEMQGLVENVLLRWDPAVFFDGHTHNGSYHQEPVTYIWGVNPNGNSSIIDYMRDKMMPAVAEILEKKYDTLSIPHGDFMDPREPEKGWRTLGPQPRYLTNYIGLRNRLAILNENYPYVDFKSRIFGCYHFLHSLLEYCSIHHQEIKNLIQEADRISVKQGMVPQAKDVFIVEYDVKPAGEKLTILGYEMEVEERPGFWPRVKISEDKKKTYRMPFYCNYIPKRTVPLPYGYLIPTPDDKVKEKLLQHGLVVERLIEPARLKVEKFRINELKASEKLFQGHRLNKIKGEFVEEEKEFPAGTLFIGTAQPLAKLAAYLLEPESDDGLFVWNFFDKYIVPQWGRGFSDYPVYKLLHPRFLVKEVILN